MIFHLISKKIDPFFGSKQIFRQIDRCEQLSGTHDDRHAAAAAAPSWRNAMKEKSLYSAKKENEGQNSDRSASRELTFMSIHQQI